MCIMLRDAAATSGIINARGPNPPSILKGRASSAGGCPSACVAMSGRSEMPGDSAPTSFFGITGDSDRPVGLGASESTQLLSDSILHEFGGQGTGTELDLNFF